MSHENPRITRRAMLGRTAGAGVLAAMAGPARSLAAAPASRGFKIGACEWSIGPMDPKCFDLARRIGLDGIQVSMGSGANGLHMTQPEVRKAYVAAAKAAGQEIASMALTELNSVPLKSDPRAAEWLAQSVGICQELGCKLTMPAFFGAGDLDMTNAAEIDRVVEAIKRVAPAAEKAGVEIGLENYLSAKDNITLIERIGSPVVKVYYDVGNSMDKGYDIYAEIRELGKRKLLCEFHFKDGRDLLGQGRIDFQKVRKAMDDADYRGWIQLESAHPGGVEPDYREQGRFLRKLYPKEG